MVSVGDSGTEEPPFEIAEEAGLCPESHGSGAVDAELDRRPAPTGGYAPYRLRTAELGVTHPTAACIDGHPRAKGQNHEHQQPHGTTPRNYCRQVTQLIQLQALGGKRGNVRRRSVVPCSLPILRCAHEEGVGADQPPLGSQHSAPIARAPQPQGQHHEHQLLPYHSARQCHVTSSLRVTGPCRRLACCDPR